MIESERNSPSETMLSLILYWAQGRNSCPCLLEDIPCRVSAAIIDDNDLVIDVMKAQLNVKVLNGTGNATVFVLRRDDNGKKTDRFPWRWP